MKNKLKPIMLPTNDKSSQLGKYADSEDLVYNNPNHTDIPRGNPQHIYFVSDEKPNKRDWCIDINANPKSKLFQVSEVNAEGVYEDKNGRWFRLYKNVKKVEATTDKSLTREHDDTVPFPKMRNSNIALISQSFIKYFVEQNGNVDEVEVECREYGIPNMNDNLPIIKTELKLTDNNEVIIHLPKEKILNSINDDFFENLVNIPNKINEYKLRINKEDDGKWVVTYETDYSYLTSKTNKHNECIHSDLELQVAIENTIKWIEENL